MAWNEPGKGNGKDPWSSGGGGNEPPDLDEVFRKLQRRLNSMFGGGGGKKDRTDGDGGGSFTGIIVAGVLLLGAWLIYDSTYIIQEEERGVVLIFGEYSHTMQPGLNFTWPRPISRVDREDVSQVRTVEYVAQMLTQDENIVALDIAVQYRINNLFDYFYKIRDPQETVRESAESAVRQIIGTNVMDFILGEGRGQIAVDSEVLLQEVLDRYNTGVLITDVNIQDVRPPTQVKDAFDDAIKAREDNQTFQNEAEAYSNSVIPESRGQAARILEEASAYKASVIARAEGQAQRFELLLSEYQRAPEVTRQRLYLETMEQVLADTSKVLIGLDGGNNIMYLPLDQIVNRSGGTRNNRGTSLGPVTVNPDEFDSRDSRSRSRSGR